MAHARLLGDEVPPQVGDVVERLAAAGTMSSEYIPSSNASWRQPNHTCTVPGGMAWSSRIVATTWPRWLYTSTLSPSTMPSRAASTGLMRAVGTPPDSSAITGSSENIDCMKKRWRPLKNWYGYGLVPSFRLWGVGASSGGRYDAICAPTGTRRSE